MRGFAPRRENDFAGLDAPHPDMRDRYMWGAAPHPDHVKRKNARLRLALRPCGDCIWGFAPCPDLGFFFGKKNPKNPKKPDWIRYNLSN